MLDVFYSLPIIFTHLLFLVFSLFWVVKSDLYGSRWILSKIDLLDKIYLHKLHRNVSIGLGGMIITGILLSLQRPYVVEEVGFKIKMLFVFILFINSFIIGYLMKLSIKNKFINLNNKQKIYLFLSGAVSTICWLGAILIAIII